MSRSISIWLSEIITIAFYLYHGECVIALNKRNTKNPKKLSSGHPICEAGLAMMKDGKSYDNHRTWQKYCCPLKQSKNKSCPCNHKCWNNGKKNRGCTKYITLPDDYRKRGNLHSRSP